MKVVCIRNHYLEFNYGKSLTYGKSYETSGSITIDYWIWVVNDQGIETRYNHSYFTTIDKYRELQIDKIL